MKRVMIRTLLSRGKRAACVVGIPKVLLSELGWKKGDKVTLSIKDGGLLVSKIYSVTTTKGRVVSINHGVIELEREDK